MPSLTIGDAEIHYCDTGTGSPVILLHSSAMSSGQWRSLVDMLSDEYRLLAPDLYGYGATQFWPGRRAFSIAEEVAIVSAMLAYADAPTHIVGHSYGGAVGLHTVLGGAANVRSLTVYEPVAFHLLDNGAPGDAALLGEVKSIAARIGEGVLAGDLWGAMEVFVDYWNGSGAWADMREEVRRDLAAQAPKVMLDFAALFSPPARVADFAALDLPVTLLAGDRTPAPTKRLTTMLAQAIAGARLETVAGAGHMGPVTHGDAVNALIVRALRELDNTDP